ncbi:MAG: hypothetical protein FWG47_06905 [Propionibacteriaceae bacterium]|nr:hypothetical protein [Propionibacteriaceae bacterium]
MAYLVPLIFIVTLAITIWVVVGSIYSYKKHQLLAQAHIPLQLGTGSAALRRADATFQRLWGTNQPMAVFAISDGSSVDLPVATSEAQSFTPGEKGILEWQGNRFIRFETLR